MWKDHSGSPVHPRRLHQQRRGLNVSCGLHAASSHQCHLGMYASFFSSVLDCMRTPRTDAVTKLCDVVFIYGLHMSCPVSVVTFRWMILHNADCVLKRCVHAPSQVAERVAAERAESVGNANSCGYQIRLQR